MAVSPDGTRAYVTDGRRPDSVSVISTATNHVIATIGVGSDPDGVAVSPARHPGLRHQRSLGQRVGDQYRD